MERINMFSAPHKALRKLMGTVSLLAGQTEAGNEAQLDELKMQGEELFFLLTLHADSENQFTLAPLEKKVPGAAAANLEEHEWLEEKQDKVHKMLRNLSMDSSNEELYDFYLAFTEFQSIYLEHILHEERETQGMLWQNFTDEELIQHRGELIQHMSFDDYMIWLKHILIAQQDSDNLGMLKGMQAGIPAPAFGRVIEVVKASLTESRSSSLLGQLLGQEA